MDPSWVHTHTQHMVFSCSAFSGHRKVQVSSDTRSQVYRAAWLRAELGPVHCDYSAACLARLNAISAAALLWVRPLLEGTHVLCSSDDEAATTMAPEDSIPWPNPPTSYQQRTYLYVPPSTSTGFWAPATKTHSDEMRHLCQLDRTEESQGTLNSATFEYASQLPSKKP